MDRSTSLDFVSEKTPKHRHAFIQTSRVFDTFWPLCRYKLIARSILTVKKLTSTLRVKLVFYFEQHLSLQTTEKSTKTFQTKPKPNKTNKQNQNVLQEVISHPPC
jgi:hypothetical protein